MQIWGSIFTDSVAVSANDSGDSRYHVDISLDTLHVQLTREQAADLHRMLGELLA